jgi:hypothetical protein
MDRLRRSRGIVPKRVRKAPPVRKRKAPAVSVRNPTKKFQKEMTPPESEIETESEEEEELEDESKEEMDESQEGHEEMYQDLEEWEIHYLKAGKREPRKLEMKESSKKAVFQIKNEIAATRNSETHKKVENKAIPQVLKMSNMDEIERQLSNIDKKLILKMNRK